MSKQLPRPEFNKSPFGGVPASKKTKGDTSELLPGQKALKQLAKGNPAQQSIQNFGRLTPIGAGALNEDIFAKTKF